MISPTHIFVVLTNHILILIMSLLLLLTHALRSVAVLDLLLISRTALLLLTSNFNLWLPVLKLLCARSGRDLDDNDVLGGVLRIRVVR